MFTIIGGDGKEYGPVTLEQVQSWIASGRANLDTQAKKAGDEQWRRLGDFSEFNASDAPPPITAEVAATPVPVPEEPITDAKAHAAKLKASTKPLDVFGCLDRSFTLWKENFLALVGVTLLIIIIQMVIGFIPILGSFAGLFLNGVFYGGLYFYYLGKLRGEPRELGDAFAGFSRAFVPLMLSSLLTTVLLLAVVMVFAGPVFFPLIKAMATAAHNSPPDLPHFSPLALAGCFVGGLIAFYLSIAWAFTFVLVVDKRIGPWTAMELSRRVVTRQWFRVFFVCLLGGILAMLGLIGLIIGVAFTLPLMFGALICAYEEMFNPPPA